MLCGICSRKKTRQKLPKSRNGVNQTKLLTSRVWKREMLFLQASQRIPSPDQTKIEVDRLSKSSNPAKPNRIVPIEVEQVIGVAAGVEAAPVLLKPAIEVVVVVRVIVKVAVVDEAVEDQEDEEANVVVAVHVVEDVEASIRRKAAPHHQLQLQLPLLPATLDRYIGNSP